MTPDPTSEAALAAERERLLAELLAAEGLDGGGDASGIAPRAAGQPVPLTFAQEVLWLLDRATPGLAAYNTPVVRRVRGPLDVRALQRAVTALVARHEALRTVFRAEGESAVQEVGPAAPIVLAVHDASAKPEGERLDVAVRSLRTIAETPFDLAREPGFRVAVARLADDDHLLLLLAHHIISDAWSFGVMLADLSTAYAAAVGGATPDLGRGALDFGDFAAWQRTTLSGEALASKIAWWKAALDGAGELVLPTDKPRPANQGFGGARRVLTLAPERAAALKAAAERAGGTLYMALLVAYTTVLRRHAAQDDVVVGSAVAARTPRETEGMVGYFSQALPMRVQARPDDSFATLLPRVAHTVLGAFEHVDVPVESLVLELQRAGGRPSHAPLFTCVLTMQEGLGADLQLPGCTATPLDLEMDATKFDLTLLVGERAEGLELALWYRTDLFTADGADRFLAHLDRTIAGIIADPRAPLAAIPLATAAEQAQLAAWNATDADEGAATTIVAEFERQAKRVGNRLAIVAPSASAAAHGSMAGSATLTYPELDARANQLAHRLLALGLTRGQPVGLLLDRSAEAIVGLLGILKAGGAYMPLAQDAPAARIARQLADAGASLVVTTSAHAELVPAVAKAVLLDSEAPTLQALSDASPALHVLGRDVATEPARFALYMTAHQLDVLKMTPNHVAALTGGRTGSELAEVLPRQWLVVGGEALPIGFARSVVQAGRCRLLNHYGPTETTVGVLTFEATAESLAEAERLGAQTVPIGRPLMNTRAVVVDGSGREQPVGVAGELWIAGLGVTRGYIGRDDLTQAAFTTWNGARAYRTGDRVRRLANGVIEFLGRADDQVKVRGYRVELGEIEQVLRGNPGVAQVAVVLRTDEGREPALVAYVVAKAAGYAVSHADRPTPEKLREWAAASLPSHMVPDAVMLLAALPLTANGKLDRRALPSPDAPAESAEAFAEPRTDTERQLATIWGDVLKREKIWRTDNVLALGGHSLLAIRVLGRISKGFGVRLPLRTLFESPTIEALAQAIEQARAGQ
ncbi:MAG: AMP-binding protein [Gemmatimonadetes bacterium]|nr:AMP-binding protein [Gemmatimonadota bacterium]